MLTIRRKLILSISIPLLVTYIGLLGWDYYRYRADPEFRKVGGMNAVLVPLGQWAAVLAVWLVVVVGEGRERRAAAGMAAERRQ